MDSNGKTNENQGAEKVAIKLASDKYRSSAELMGEYSRKLDDVNKRRKYVEECFGDKKTIKDPYSGEVLHKNRNAARNKYGQKNTTKHTADVDHTVPLKEVYDRAEKNPFLDCEDVKNIANTKSNYKIISSKTNRSKQSKSNKQYLKSQKDKGIKVPIDEKCKIYTEQFKAEMVVDAAIIQKTAINAHAIGKKSAIQAGKFQGAISSVKNAKRLLDGEKNIEEATTEVIKDTSTAMLGAYGTSIGAHIVEYNAKYVVQNSSNTFVKKIANGLSIPGNAAKMVTAAVDAGELVIKFINGDINGEELVIELGQKGTAMASAIMMGSEGAFIGAVAGEAIGAFIGAHFFGIGAFVGAEVGGTIGFVTGELLGNMIGYIMGSEIYSRVAQKLNNPKWNPKEKERINRLYDKLYENLCIYEKELVKKLDRINEKFEKNIKSGFNIMKECIESNDYEGINYSLDIICNEFNTEVSFKSIKEFKNFLDSDEIFTIGKRNKNVE